MLELRWHSSRAGAFKVVLCALVQESPSLGKNRMTFRKNFCEDIVAGNSFIGLPALFFLCAERKRLQNMVVFEEKKQKTSVNIHRDVVRCCAIMSIDKKK